MPFALDPEIGAALGALMGPNGPPPPLPAGDVKGRRELLDGLLKALAAAGQPVHDVDVKEFHTKSDDGWDVTLRWYTKKDSALPGSAVAYAHGGGYIALTIDHYAETVKRYVSQSGVPFMMIDYRLSPEVKAPQHVKDVYAGLKYLFDHASELGVDTKRVAIMGDSAGGGITASLAHYIKLKGGPAVKKQILIYPMLDDRTLTSDPNIAPYATWTYDDNITGWTNVLGDKQGKDDVDPIEAPGRMTEKDARGLPPAYIDVGELDVFRDEDLEYARNLGKAGVECEFHLIPGAPHAFEAFAPQAAVSVATMANRVRVISKL